MHLFILCETVKSIWQLHGWWSIMQVHIQNQNTFAAIKFSILQALNEDQASLFMVVLWSIWKLLDNKLVGLCYWTLTETKK
jgi:Na+/H+ antiporter NhaB